jgi:hypothetical protein
MHRLRKSALPFIILLLFLGLGLSLRSYLMAYIIEPVALLFWAIWRIVSSVDQNIYWMALIVVCLFLVVRFIPYGKAGLPSSAYNDSYKSLDRVENWQTLFKEADLGKKETDRLRASLKELFIATAAQQERSDLTGTQEMNVIEKASLSPEARRYLSPPGANHVQFSTNDPPDLALFVSRQLRTWAMKFIHPDRALLEEILSRMEADLKIKPELESKDER